jgi:hypothetical protein
MLQIILPLGLLVGVLVGWMVGRARGMPVLGADRPREVTTHGRPEDLPADRIPGAPGGCPRRSPAATP